MSDLLSVDMFSTVIGPALIEIVLLFAVFYFVLRFLQGTRGAGVLRGLVFFLIMALIRVLFFVG